MCNSWSWAEWERILGLGWDGEEDDDGEDKGEEYGDVEVLEDDDDESGDRVSGSALNLVSNPASRLVPVLLGVATSDDPTLMFIFMLRSIFAA